MLAHCGIDTCLYVCMDTFEREWHVGAHLCGAVDACREQDGHMPCETAMEVVH